MKWDKNLIPNQKGEIIIITGASSGLGKETARVLSKKQAEVIIAVRNLKKGKKVIEEMLNENPNAKLTLKKLDLSNLESVREFAKDIINEYTQLNVLINNAGVMFSPYSETKDGFELQMGTNHFGHFALTGLLMPLLKKSDNSRVVMLSSSGHTMGNINFSDINWGNRKYNPHKAYGDSKIANLYFTYELAKKLEKSANHPKVTVAHPGWTATELQRHSGVMSVLNNFFSQKVDMGILPILRAAFDESAKPGDFFGPKDFFHMKGYPMKHRSNKLSYNMEKAKKLWEISELMTGVKY